MAFGVFIHRADSIYEDSPAQQYQFPGQYFSRVAKCVGDWIVYYEPTKVPLSRGYFAVAKVDKVVPDPTAENMFLALIVPDSYLDFADPVPFDGADGIAETGLLNEHGAVSGRAQAAVRALSANDFGKIVTRGLGDVDAILPRVDTSNEFDEEGQMPFVLEEERERLPLLTSRIVRDRVFRRWCSC